MLRRPRSFAVVVAVSPALGEKELCDECNGQCLGRSSQIDKTRRQPAKTRYCDSNSFFVKVKLGLDCFWCLFTPGGDVIITLPRSDVMLSILGRFLARRSGLSQHCCTLSADPRPAPHLLASSAAPPRENCHVP